MKNLSEVFVFCLSLFYSSALAYGGTYMPYTIKASSFLKGMHSYEASNLYGIDTSMGWCTDKYGKEDVWLKITPSHPLKDNFQLLILPGYAKSNNLFYANSRPKKVRLLGKDEKGNEILSKIITLQDKPQMQSFMVNLKDLSRDLDELWLSVIDVYLGMKYEDFCITEISLYMDLQENMTNKEKNNICKKEIAVIKKSIKEIEDGKFISVINLFRLSSSLYYETAEGGEWLDELYLDYLIKEPDEFLFLLSRQMEGIKKIVEKALLTPVSDKYDVDIMSKALSKAIASGGVKNDYPELVKKYIK